MDELEMWELETAPPTPPLPPKKHHKKVTRPIVIPPPPTSVAPPCQPPTSAAPMLTSMAAAAMPPPTPPTSSLPPPPPPPSKKFHKPQEDTVEQHVYPLGDRNDRELIVFSNGVIVRSKSDAQKFVELDLNRWGWLRPHLKALDEEAKELNRNTRKVNFRVCIGGPWYVSITSTIFCVDFRKYYVGYGLPHVPGLERPSRHGLSLRLDEWKSFVKLVPMLEAKYPNLAAAEPCYARADHQNMLAGLSCSYCNPFDTNNELPA